MRVTVFHTAYPKAAHRRADRERAKFPDADVRVTGEQGSWKVRRDLRPNENEHLVRHHGPISTVNF